MKNDRNFVQYSVANNLVHGGVPELSLVAPNSVGGGD